MGSWRSWVIERIRSTSSRLSIGNLYLYLEERCLWVENLQALISGKDL